MFDVASLFLSEETLRKRKEREVAYVQEQARRRGQIWDEFKTKFDRTLLLNGAKYDVSQYQIFDTAPVLTPQLHTAAKSKSSKFIRFSPDRNFVYANRILPAGHRLDLFQGHRRGTVGFSTDITIPVLFEHKPGTHDYLRVWMGITPAEMMSQRAGVRRATGHVLIGGLGLGWLLRKVAEKPSVKKITVVEISQELLDWFGTDLCNDIAAATDTPIEVYCDDVLNHLGKHGDDVRHLIDIWPDYPTYRCYLPRAWKEALVDVKHFWGWGVLSEPAPSRW